MFIHQLVFVCSLAICFPVLSKNNGGNAHKSYNWKCWNIHWTEISVYIVILDLFFYYLHWAFTPVNLSLYCCYKEFIRWLSFFKISLSLKNLNKLCLVIASSNDSRFDIFRCLSMVFVNFVFTGWVWIRHSLCTTL